MANEKEQEQNNAKVEEEYLNNDEQMTLSELREKKKEEKKQRLEELGYKPLVVLDKVVNRVDILSDNVREIETKNGKRYMFDCGSKDLMASNFLAEQIIEATEKTEKGAPYHLQIVKNKVKTEQGERTQYQVSLLDENGKEMF